jgi:putative component of membrane protein insertase Oxa1/YidC/SpoIIIJ protein YidD
MKNIFLFIIKIYQVFIPKRFRGECLFKESCSHYVYRLTKENGFSDGISALRYRVHHCKPNYFITENKGKILLITAQHKVIEEEFLSKNIINEFYKQN